MRKHPNKLFFNKYTHKASFKTPFAGWMYPTTDEHLRKIVTDPFVFSEKSYLYRNIMIDKKQKEHLRRLASFILTNRNNIKFRLQTSVSYFYGSSSVIRDLILEFWDHWFDIKSVDKKYLDQVDKNTILCTRLPHKKYQYQVHLKKFAHLNMSKTKREQLASYLFRSKDNTYVSGKHLKMWLMGDSDYSEGYFYVKDEKCLTPVYMIAQESIDKIIKFVTINRNDRNNTKTN